MTTASCWQLDGRERVKPHPAKSHRDAIRERTILTIKDRERLAERKERMGLK